MTTTQPLNEITARKNYLAGLLEMACQELELPEPKRAEAERAYLSVGKWLNECQVLNKFSPVIFPQGSMALGTTVRPLEREEFDVDLVCHLTDGDHRLPQANVKTAVGNRLESHEVYQKMLKEHKRCWRLNYAEEAKLHLDITPAVKNLKCANGGLFVTDRELKKWYPTNPKGYIEWFDGKSKFEPKFPSLLLENMTIRAKQAQVEPLPDHLPLKGLLRRCVQLLKRHRNLRFQKKPEKAPISIILTTLAANSYEAAAVSDTIYDTEFDLLLDVIARMPTFVERRRNGVEHEWWIPNETTEGENFAEKWNKDAELPQAFKEWHGTALSDFKKLADAGDHKTTYQILENMAGGQVTASVRNRVTSDVSKARVNQLLKTGTGGALTVGSGLPVRGNTFFGK
jgi:hypothetical protein